MTTILSMLLVFTVALIVAVAYLLLKADEASDELARLRERLHSQGESIAKFRPFHKRGLEAGVEKARAAFNSELEQEINNVYAVLEKREQHLHAMVVKTLQESIAGAREEMTGEFASENYQKGYARGWHQAHLSHRSSAESELRKARTLLWRWNSVWGDSGFYQSLVDETRAFLADETGN